jgi:PAS domain-containing protein
VPGTATPVARAPAPVGGILSGLLELPRNAIALLHGPKGVGKSTLVLSMLQEPWLCGDEMVPELVLAYVTRQGSRLAGISRPEWIGEPINDMDLRIPDREVPPDVIVDSATATGHPVETLRALRRYTARYGTRGLVIVQQTKDGQARGSATLAFDVDVEIELEIDRGERRAVITKNRFGWEGSRAYALTDRGIGLPTFSGYYSVEGVPGRYRLVRHPAPTRMPYAGYLWAVEEDLAGLERLADEDLVGRKVLELPPGPVAVAAQRSRLYRGGWVEPQDWEARRVFAEAHGLPYFSPAESRRDDGNHN